jgi:hypothetical protein
MMRKVRARVLAPAAAALAFLATHAVAGFEYHKFQTPKGHLLASVRTIALRPVFGPPKLANREAVVRQFETEVTATLEGAGFRVIPSTAFEQVWRDNARRLGGVFDVVTGELDDQKFDTCYEYTARELARLHGIDAIAIVSLTTGAIDGGFIRQLRGGSLAYAVGDSMVLHGKELRTSKHDELQFIQGSFLDLGLYDLAGVSVYTTSVPVEWNRVYWNRSYVDREDAPWSHPERNSAAVREAVRPLEKSDEPEPAASRPAPRPVVPAPAAQPHR